jgi:hypothetical protein
MAGMQKDCRNNPCQRFGSALNAHLHFHICVIDGVFSQGAAGELRFHPATVLSQSDVAALQSLVRHRVLRLFQRTGLLGPEPAENMRQWRHGADSPSMPASPSRPTTEPILVHLGLPAEPPPLAPARDPPLEGIDQTPAFDMTDPAPVPEYAFDHSVSW